MKSRKNETQIPLIVEQHPSDYDGYPFITLIQHCQQHVLVLVDNADDKMIRSYVLDLCGPAKINEEKIITVAAHWWDRNRESFPLSIQFSRAGMAGEVQQIYRTFNIEFVTRVIGPLPRFDMSSTRSVKRRKRKPISKNIKVNTKQLLLREGLDNVLLFNPLDDGTD